MWGRKVKGVGEGVKAVCSMSSNSKILSIGNSILNSFIMIGLKSNIT